MCIKWDETEQKVLAPVLADSAARTTMTVHVATAGVFIKTSTMERPSMWNTPPQRVERTTADCLWKFLQRVCPFGPWGILPSAAACVWLVFVLCCDEASSNKRMIAFFEVKALAQWLFVIVWFSPCFLHILHRAVMPALKRDNLVGDLYRATHVLVVSLGSLQMSLVQGMRENAVGNALGRFLPVRHQR